MDIQVALKKLIQGQNLDADEMHDVMKQIMTGNATEAQIGGFLTALSIKGETVTEITTAAKVMRSLANKINIDSDHIIDTCGTGGSGISTFNISTTCALILAAAGAKVAKHGNRSTGKSGSADVLEAAGINLQLTADEVKDSLDKLGIGFLFAPNHHSAMKYAIGPRKEMAIRTVFNLLGPLTNPANATHQVIGVFDKKWLTPMAEVLKELGSQHVLVVHGEDGLDEISIAAETHVAELKNGVVTSYTISPTDFSIPVSDNLNDIIIKDPLDSLTRINEVLDGKAGAARNIVLLNAGAAIYAVDLAEDIQSGINKAAELIDSGAAKNKLNALIAHSKK